MKFVNKVIFVGVCMLCFIVVAYVFYSYGFELGQTEALRGHQEYEMIITYQRKAVEVHSVEDTSVFVGSYFVITRIGSKEVGYIKKVNEDTTLFFRYGLPVIDTVYIPVDTTFVKK
jgi:hypothetical protein